MKQKFGKFKKLLTFALPKRGKENGEKLVRIRGVAEEKLKASFNKRNERLTIAMMEDIKAEPRGEVKSSFFKI